MKQNRIGVRMFATALSFMLCLSLAACCLIMPARADILPEPAAFNTDAAAPSFSMTAIGGSVLNETNYGAGRNLLMVYGRIWCWNTRAFLTGIRDAVQQLKEAGVTVLVGLHDDPTDDEMQEFAEMFPGIVCGKVSNYYHESGMWTGLEAVGEEDGSVIFPVVFLRSPDGRLRYYSTGYVDEPLSVVSAAIVMAGGKPSGAALILPENLTVIADDAFRKGTFTSVECGPKVTGIGAHAFAENPNLEWIYIPANVTEIDPTAFDGDDGLMIYGEAGSSAETFAKGKGIPFRVR